MFYTVRRANVPGLNGAEWVHGSPIGIATSPDGATWTYAGVAKIHYPDAVSDPTWWAPAVVYHQGLYHMYLTYVPGVFSNWSHPRHLLHLTSTDLINWQYESTLPLEHAKDIDAGVLRVADGTWRLWYKDEMNGSSTHYADSPDLSHWTDRGRVEGLSDKNGEAPLPFHWKGHYWFLRDIATGLALYRSDDATAWKRIGTLLAEPGTGPDDKAVGKHPDVIISGGRAYLYYFTHPGIAKDGADGRDPRRTSLQVAELQYDSPTQTITCDRNRPVVIDLQPLMQL